MLVCYLFLLLLLDSSIMIAFYLFLLQLGSIMLVCYLFLLLLLGSSATLVLRCIVSKASRSSLSYSLKKLYMSKFYKFIEEYQPIYGAKGRKLE
jgi:hypothetical protein